MKIVLQRVSSASVCVDEKEVGKISKGYVIFLGIGANDTKEDCDRLVDKIIKLRIFSDENDKINLSINDVNGEFLVISQFTLYADCKKNRPSFSNAGKPDMANQLYEYFKNRLIEKGQKVESGIFGASMQVSLLNDGPFTLTLE